MADRRRHYTVDPMVRNFYVTMWALALIMLSLIAYLFVLVSKNSEGWGKYAASGGWLDINLPFVVISGGVIITMIGIMVAVYATIHIHRLHGAAYRIQMGLDAFADGGGAYPIKLRPGDYLVDLADKINSSLGDGPETPGDESPDVPDVPFEITHKVEDSPDSDASEESTEESSET